MISRGLARYRFTLTEALSDAFHGKVQIVASPIPWNKGLWEVDWDKLKEREGSLLFREILGVSLRTLAYALIRRFNARDQQGSLASKRLTVSEVNPDLIAIHEYSWFMVKLALYARLAGIPCLVFTELGRAGNQHGISWLTRFCHAIGAWLTTAQVANTPAAKVPFGALKRHVLYLPYAVDTAEFTQKPLPPSRREITILMVGQFIPRKGADLLLKALKTIHGKTATPFLLRLVGNQDDLWIRGEVERSGLGAIVEIVGIKQGRALVEEYHRSDIFVLPSRFDTYGVVVHEAASCGLPLLISRHAGAAEALVKDGVNGWVIDPEETVEFGRLLRELIDNPGLRDGMGNRSREIAEEICIGRQAKMLAGWMSGMLSDRGKLSRRGQAALKASGLLGIGCGDSRRRDVPTQFRGP